MNEGPSSAPAAQRRTAPLVFLILALLGGSLLAFRAVRPSAGKARAALRDGKIDEARRLAEGTLLLFPGDREAARLLDEIDLQGIKQKTSPRERTELASSLVLRTPEARERARALILAEAEEAVRRKDATALEEQRAGLARTATDLDAHLVGLRELIAVDRCVSAPRTDCADLFRTVPHEASRGRVEAFRARYLRDLVKIFRDATALIAEKPDPRVAGAAYRDQNVSARQHHLLATPAEREKDLEAFVETHTEAREKARFESEAAKSPRKGDSRDRHWGDD